jgi:hypothetical protein
MIGDQKRGNRPRVVCTFLAAPDADARLRRVYEILLRSAAADDPPPGGQEKRAAPSDAAPSDVQHPDQEVMACLSPL